MDECTTGDNEHPNSPSHSEHVLETGFTLQNDVHAARSSPRLAAPYRGPVVQ